jgi:hypothetical protein
LQAGRLQPETTKKYQQEHDAPWILYGGMYLKGNAKLTRTTMSEMVISEQKWTLLAFSFLVCEALMDFRNATMTIV